MLFCYVDSSSQPQILLQLCGGEIHKSFIIKFYLVTQTLLKASKQCRKGIVGKYWAIFSYITMLFQSLTVHEKVKALKHGRTHGRTSEMRAFLSSIV